MIDIGSFVRLRDGGATPQAICVACKAQSLSDVDTIRVLREVFAMDLRSAKGILVGYYNPGKSVEAHQSQLIDDLERELSKKK